MGQRGFEDYAGRLTQRLSTGTQGNPARPARGGAAATGDRARRRAHAVGAARRLLRRRAAGRGRCDVERATREVSREPRAAKAATSRSASAVRMASRRRSTSARICAGRLSALTLPHALARVVVVEALYRAREHHQGTSVSPGVSRNCRAASLDLHLHSSQFCNRRDRALGKRSRGSLASSAIEQALEAAQLRRQHRDRVVAVGLDDRDDRSCRGTGAARSASRRRSRRGCRDRCADRPRAPSACSGLM